MGFHVNSCSTVSYATLSGRASASTTAEYTTARNASCVCEQTQGGGDGKDLTTGLPIVLGIWSSGMILA